MAVEHAHDWIRIPCACWLIGSGDREQFGNAQGRIQVANACWCWLWNTLMTGFGICILVLCCAGQMCWEVGWACMAVSVCHSSRSEALEGASKRFDLNSLVLLHPMRGVISTQMQSEPSCLSPESSMQGFSISPCC